MKNIIFLTSYPMYQDYMAKSLYEKCRIKDNINITDENDLDGYKFNVFYFVIFK